MRTTIIPVGTEFGRLKTTGPKFRVEGKTRARYFIPVRCECGTEKTVNATDLAKGCIQSCGCLFRDVHSQICAERNLTHGMSHTPEHNSWSHMIQRCDDPNYKKYAGYGGRGITVHESFRDFETFYAHIGPRPKGTSLDRIDNNRGYEPGNVRWANAVEQASNRRSNFLVTYEGRTQTVTAWAIEFGINKVTLINRLYRGWTPEEAFKLPPRPMRAFVRRQQ